MPRRALRLFVAVYPPPDTARALREATSDWLDDAGLVAAAAARPRLVPLEQIHLTLLFIGDTAPSQVDDVAESVARSAAGLPACMLAPQRLVRLPTRGPARLVAVEADAPSTITEIHERLVTRLARPAPRRKDRPYLPHLTTCRFRAPVPHQALEPMRPSRLDVAPFAVQEIALVRSRLDPKGAEHVTIGAWPLAGSARGDVPARLF